MSQNSVWRSIRNWPRKLIGLHKTDRKIKQLTRDIAGIKQSLSGQPEGGNAEQCRQALNMGETILAAAGIEPNIYSFIKSYAGESGFRCHSIKPQDLQYFVDLAAAFCSKSFAPRLYSLETMKARVRSDTFEIFLKELREQFLYPSELDVTANHSIGRPFHFWSVQEKQDYIRTALKVTEALKELSPYCCFGYGTVLAARRDGHFIPHDDDADILLYLPKTEGVNNRTEAVQYVARFLEEKGFSLGWVSLIHLKVLAGKTKSIIKDIDVFLSLEGETPGHSASAPRADWVPGSAEGFALDSLFPPRELMLEGIAIPCPRDTDAYLETTYGKTWQIPDKNFHYGAKDWRTE